MFKKNVMGKLADVFDNIIEPLFTLVITGAAVIGLVTAVVVFYVSVNAKSPAGLYRSGDIINLEYEVINTDEKNILWLNRIGDNYVYIAEISCEKFLELSFWEKVKAVAADDKLSDFTEFKIIKKIENNDKRKEEYFSEREDYLE